MKHLLILILLLSLSAYGCNPWPQDDFVCINKSCFSVEVADTPTERQQGLMFRDSLGKDEGMLFIFDEPGTYSFWMKNTDIALDIIWVDEDGRIVSIKSDAQPCTKDPCLSFSPKVDALYVLEISGGRARELDIKVGDKVDIRIK